MSTNFPTGLDTLINPTGSDPVTNPSHASQHANANDAIEALQTKVGADSSAVTTTHDFKLSGVTTGDKATSLTGTETLTNKTLTTPVIPSMYQDAGKTKLMSLPNSASDEIVVKNATQSLTNKTLTDDTNTIRANSLKSATTTISIDGATAPTAGQVLTATSSTNATWQDPTAVSEDYIRTTTISLSSSDILNGYTTPKTLISAPGVGKLIVVDSVVYSFTAGTQYTGGGAHQIRYNGDTNDLVNTGASTYKFTNASSFIYEVVPISSGTGTGVVVTTGTNKAVEWSNATGAYATGNGTAKIFITYRILIL